MITDQPITDLVTRARNGDQRAWDDLVERYAPLVWTVCRRYQLRSADAEDVHQTVWLQLVSQLDKIRDPGALPGWLATSTGYDRQWAAQHGDHTPVISALVSLFEYHKAMLAFNTGLTTHHPYESRPWTWLVLSRPVSFFWCPDSGAHPVCSGGKAQEVLALGTPAIWWTSVVTLLVCLGWWLTRRDWRAGAVLLGVVAGWLPWFAFSGRTQFSFYAVAFVPFLVLSITLCLGLVLGPVHASAQRRAVGAAVAGAYVLAVLLNFAYLYPVLAAKVIPYSQWLARMWYHGWI